MILNLKGAEKLKELLNTIHDDVGKTVDFMPINEALESAIEEVKYLKRSFRNE